MKRKRDCNSYLVFDQATSYKSIKALLRANLRLFLVPCRVLLPWQQWLLGTCAMSWYLERSTAKHKYTAIVVNFWASMANTHAVVLWDCLIIRRWNDSYKGKLRSIVHSIGRDWEWDKQLQSQTKELGHEVSSPLPPLSMLIIRWLFPVLLEKRDIFQHWLGGMGDT